MEAPWRGEFPGVPECRERGWFATLVPGKGWQPRGPEEADQVVRQKDGTVIADQEVVHVTLRRRRHR